MTSCCVIVKYEWSHCACFWPTSEFIRNGSKERYFSIFRRKVFKEYLWEYFFISFFNNKPITSISSSQREVILFMLMLICWTSFRVLETEFLNCIIYENDSKCWTLASILLRLNRIARILLASLCWLQLSAFKCTKRAKRIVRCQCNTEMLMKFAVWVGDLNVSRDALVHCCRSGWWHYLETMGSENRDYMDFNTSTPTLVLVVFIIYAPYGAVNIVHTIYYI